MSFAVHLLLGASEEDIPSEASEKPRAGGCTGP